MGSCELVKDLQEAPLRVMQRETVSDHLRCGQVVASFLHLSLCH